MSLESTDDLIPLPHIVLVVRGEKLAVRDFPSGVEGQLAAHAYAESEAKNGAVVTVAARYRRISPAKETP